MTHDPNKAPIPQTVEALQAENAELQREIGDLRSRLNRAQFKNQTLWKRLVSLEREMANG